MENKNTITLEKLIAKKLEKDGRKGATKEIYVESLDGNITVVNPSDEQQIRFSDTAKSGDYCDMMKAYRELIYDCCPMLHSKELQESIDVVYPYDTVSAIFEIKEIGDIGGKILNFFDDDEDDADENLKNL